jgi:hypothetical protein
MGTGCTARQELPESIDMHSKRLVTGLPRAGEVYNRLHRLQALYGPLPFTP